MAALSLAEHLARVPDPRQNSGKRHSLAALLNLVSVAVLCGMRSLEAIAQFGRSLAPATAKALGFTHPKTPCKSTLSVVLRALPVDALEQELREWAPQHDAGEGSVSVDGKAIRGSADGEAGAVHLLAVYAVKAGVTLAQVAVGDKTNEHKAALDLLRQVPLEGRVITGDAMFTHRDFCETVLEGGGDYVLPAKDNQPTLVRDIKAAFTPSAGLSPPTASVAGRRLPASQRHDQGARPPGEKNAADHHRAQRLPRLAESRPSVLAGA